MGHQVIHGVLHGILAVVRGDRCLLAFCSLVLAQSEASLEESVKHFITPWFIENFSTNVCPTCACSSPYSDIVPQFPLASAPPLLTDDQKDWGTSCHFQARTKTVQTFFFFFFFWSLWVLFSILHIRTQKWTSNVYTWHLFHYHDSFLQKARIVICKCFLWIVWSTWAS